MGSVSERVLRVAPCSVLVVRGSNPDPAPNVRDVSVRRVLVAVDLSDHSRRALEVAALVAQRLGASLEALHVWAVPFYADEGTGRAGLLDRMRETARAELDAFIDGFIDGFNHRGALPAPLEIERTIVSGAPTAAISEHAASRHADLLVLGTHGYGGVKRLVLGSVAEAVARYSSCATLVVR
jgi:nucleotide-binding universal stress UspA family protein